MTTYTHATEDEPEFEALTPEELEEMRLEYETRQYETDLPDARRIEYWEQY